MALPDRISPAKPGPSSGLVKTEVNTSHIQAVAVPLASGTMPLAFSALETSISSAQVVGGVRPACLNTALLT